MEKKINIAELLKDCPKGMELDCIIFNGKVYFEGIDNNNSAYPIKISVNLVNIEHLDIYGQYNTRDYSKCVIFPKGKTTWEGFHRPFKDGDILATDLGSVFYLNTRLNTDDSYGCYVGIGGDGSFRVCERFAYKECCGFAIEEEKEKLFKAIKDNGYKWNPETKILEKLIEPKFKVGDVIQYIDRYKVKITEVNIEDECYRYESMIAKGIGSINFSAQDNWELVPNKFDINTLVPFESKVLVRDNDYDEWKGAFWSHLRQKADIKYDTTRGVYRQCIPYEGNEHLLGKTDDCEDYYKTWL